MSNLKYTKTIFLRIILIFIVCCTLGQTQPMVNAQDQSSEVGRDNPFAKITRISRPIGSVDSKPSELIKEEPPELFMQTIMLKFLNARSLKEALDNMCSEYGTIATNEENNSIIVCDTKENLERIVTEIKKADKTPQQILVEVVIVDVQLSDDTEIGVNWDILSDKNYDIGYRQNFTNRLGANPEEPGDISSFNTTGTGGDFSVISGTIRNVLAMLQKKREIEILASPRVMVVSGKTASIEAVSELPYNEITNTSEGGLLSSTQFKKVGVKLNVTATLTEDNLIFLSVDSEQSVPVGESIAQVPIIDTRNTASELLLKDGQVVIIGGLRRKETTKEINQIPILGDIPLIGFLFRYIHNVINNTELIVLLSPHIYKEGEPIPEDMMDKYKEIKDRPILSLSKEARLNEYRDQLEQRLKKQTAAIEQLQQKISESEQAEIELKEYRARLEKRTNEQDSTNKQLEQDIAESKQAENELREYQNQLKRRIKEQIKQQNVVNKQLQEQITEGKQVENDLKEHYDHLKLSLEKKNSDIDQLQQQINSRIQAERDVAKKMLLEKIRILQNRKDKEATEELLSALRSLDKILSQEIQESLNSSEKALNKRTM
jgi:flagellar biosynthesis GTPase FlhF